MLQKGNHVRPSCRHTLLPIVSSHVCPQEKSEVRSGKSEIGSWQSEVRSRKSGVGSRRSQVGSRKFEEGSLKSKFDRLPIFPERDQNRRHTSASRTCVRENE